MAVIKRIFYLTLLTNALLKPALAAYRLTDQFPQEYIDLLQVFTAPWPEYTFGMFYFLVLMSILMGIVFYFAVSKVFPSDQFGAEGASGISTAMSVIMTLIVIKFIPFIYYFVIAVILVAIVVLYSMWIFLGGLTKFVPKESKWKKVATLFVSGAIMIGVGTLSWLLTDQFSKAEVLLSGLFTIGGAITAIGIILIIIATAYAIWTPGFVRALGGERGEKAVLGHELAELTNEAKVERQEQELFEEIERDIAAATQLLRAKDLSGAKARVKDTIKKVQKALKEAGISEKEARRILSDIHALEEEEQIAAGYTPQRIESFEKGIERLAAYVDNLEKFKSRLMLETNEGLHQVLSLIEKKKDLDKAITILAKLRVEFERLRGEIPAAKGAINEMEQLVEATEQAAVQAGAAPAAAAGGLGSINIPPPP